MSRQIALLRAINVGGRTVTMAHLRHLFEALGFVNVETFIASGNVIFDTRKSTDLATQIEAKLRAALGFEVAAFIRTPVELSQVARYEPFTKKQMQAASALNVAFVASPPMAPAVEKLMALQNDIEWFHVHGREVFWLCRVKQSQSKFSTAVLERTIGQQATMRGAGTISKMAARYGQGSD